MDKYNHPPFLIKRFYNTPPTPYILDESYQPSIDEMLFISELGLAYAKRERELELQLTIEKLLAILADEQINPHTYDITDLGTIHATIGCIITYERPYYHLYRVQHGKHNLLLQTQDEHIISEACLQELARIIPALRNISALLPTPTARLTSQIYSTNKQYIFRIIIPIHIFPLIFYHLLWYNILKQ